MSRGANASREDVASPSFREPLLLFSSQEEEEQHSQQQETPSLSRNRLSRKVLSLCVSLCLFLYLCVCMPGMCTCVVKRRRRVSSLAKGKVCTVLGGVRSGEICRDIPTRATHVVSRHAFLWALTSVPIEVCGVAPPGHPLFTVSLGWCAAFAVRGCFNRGRW